MFNKVKVVVTGRNLIRNLNSIKSAKVKNTKATQIRAKRVIKSSEIKEDTNSWIQKAATWKIENPWIHFEMEPIIKIAIGGIEIKSFTIEGTIWKGYKQTEQINRRME